MDHQQFLVWSPYSDIPPFNPRITQTGSSLPMSPFVGVSSPYLSSTTSSSTLATSEILDIFSLASVPIMGPPPGSQESATPHKQPRLEVSGTPSPPQSIDTIELIQTSGDLIEEILPVDLTSAETPQPSASIQQDDCVSPQAEEVDMLEECDRDSDTEYTVRGRGTAKKVPRVKFGKDSNILDGMLVDGGLTSPISRNSMFFCPSCEKGYKFRKHCRRHMLIHTGRKPFACKYCPKVFARQDTLQRHNEKCNKEPTLHRVYRSHSGTRSTRKRAGMVHTVECSK